MFCFGNITKFLRRYYSGANRKPRFKDECDKNGVIGETVNEFVRSVY